MTPDLDLTFHTPTLVRIERMSDGHIWIAVDDTHLNLTAEGEIWVNANIQTGVEMTTINWFNISAPMWRIGGTSVKLWNAFNRRAKGAHYWGFGLLQIGRRHLVYVGHNAISLFWIGRSK